MNLVHANAFKRMSVCKTAGHCIVLALKNETGILSSVQWIFCSAAESVRERERECANGRMEKKIQTGTNLCMWQFSRDFQSLFFSERSGQGSRILLDGNQEFHKGRFLPPLSFPAF